MPGLTYPVENPMNRAMSMSGQATGITAGMDKRQTLVPPDKTVGGGMMSGMGGAASGASVGAMVAKGTATGASTGGGYGAIIGGVLGLAAYFLS